MKIIYTKHALIKFNDLKLLGIKTTKKTIKEIIKNPDNLDEDTDPPKIIASGSYSHNLILRIVYRQEGDIIIIITFYPAKKGRYYI